jgi:hypothetical protein
VNWACAREPSPGLRRVTFGTSDDSRLPARPGDMLQHCFQLRLLPEVVRGLPEMRLLRGGPQATHANGGGDA